MPSDSARPLPTISASAGGAHPGGPDLPSSDDGPRTPRDPLDAARRILAAPADAHRSALGSALEEARGVLRGLRSSGNGRAARVAHELGALSLGPVDAERFAALLGREQASDPEHLSTFERAVAALESALSGSAISEVHVGDDESLEQAVSRALRDRGRGFGAVRVLALLRAGEFHAGEHADLLHGLPFRAWRTLERALAPPVLVSVEGSRLDTVPALAPVLDGGMKLVLIVRGACAPAPMARLIAPGVLVIQGTEAEALERLSGFDGPGVVALVPESAATFLHDPRATPTLEILRMPQTPPRGWVGGMSPAQQARDLAVLEAWSRTASTQAESTGPDGGPAAGAPGIGGDDPPRPEPTAEPAERLAAWLLSQAGPDAGGGT